MDSHQNMQVESQQTLHDFVLNLITDADARSAFDLDPEGALRAAGLNDITAADVQDVVPLVIDYAPVEGFTGQPQSGDPTGVLDQVGGLDAISHLQSVTQQFVLSTPSTSVDAGTWALGAITVEGAVGGNPVGFGVSGGAGMSAESDVAHTLDAEVVNDLDVPALGVPGMPTVPEVPAVPGTGEVTDGLFGTADPFLGPLDGATGLVDVPGVGETLDGLGGLPAVPSVPGPTPDLNAGLDGAAGGALTGDSGSLTGGLTGGLETDATRAGADGSGQLDLSGGLF